MQHLKAYQNMTIYRQSAILLLAAPIPAALVKLQGSILDSQTIATLALMANLFMVFNVYINKLNTKTLFILGNGLSSFATLLIFALWYMDVDYYYILVAFPLITGVSFNCLSTLSNQVKNRLKNKYGKEFDSSEYDARKTTFTSAGAVLGQALAIAFYMLVDVNPMIILVFTEMAKTVIFNIAEISRWKLMKEMDVLN